MPLISEINDWLLIGPTVHFCSNGPYSSGVYSTKMISDIVPHEALLVIEQPTDTAKRCDVTTSIGLGGGEQKKICIKRWGCIDTFHVIEILPIQLYIAAKISSVYCANIVMH